MAVLRSYQLMQRRGPRALARWGGASRRVLLGLVLGLLALAAHAQRPLLRLDLLGASSSAYDPTYVYVEAGASTGFDANFDAPKLPNSNGLNLASVLPSGQQFAIKGLPPSALTAPYALGLFVGIPQDDTYTLQVVQLDNFGLATVYLVDTELQTRQLLALGTTYTFPLSGASTGGTYTSTRFSLAFEPAAGPLPVTLVAFTAQRQGTDGLVQWTTATEQHSAYFEVQSSPDGTTFTALGRVAGAGTSAQAHHYQLVDAHLARYATPQVYYRLRQVDSDGTSTFSPVCALAVPPPTGLLVALAAGAGSLATDVTLSVTTGQAGPATWLLLDAQGRVLHQQQAALPVGTTTLPPISVAGLAPGVYLVRVQQGSQHQTLKLAI